MTTTARYLVALLALAPLAACNSPTDPTAALYQPPEGVTQGVPPVGNTVTHTASRTPTCRPVGPGGGCKVDPPGAP